MIQYMTASNLLAMYEQGADIHAVEGQYPQDVQTWGGNVHVHYGETYAHDERWDTYRMDDGVEVEHYED